MQLRCRIKQLQHDMEIVSRYPQLRYIVRATYEMPQMKNHTTNEKWGNDTT